MSAATLAPCVTRSVADVVFTELGDVAKVAAASVPGLPIVFALSSRHRCS